MAKTKPIGVRFDLDLLEGLKNVGIDTPQRALNVYEALFKKHLSENIDSLNSQKELHIYKLINPLDNTVFYIGRTTFSLQFRLGGHIAQINSTTTTEHLNRRKISIIQEIIKAGKKPIIELIETIIPLSENEYRGYHEREVFWMVHYINEGQPLTNKISKNMIEAVSQKNIPPQSAIAAVVAKSEVYDSPKIDRAAIMAQIKTIEAEKIPKERDTSIGRPSWRLDQQKRINELKKQLQNEDS